MEKEKKRNPAASMSAPEDTWTVDQLKEYLRQHGGRLSGKKSDLVARCVSLAVQTLFHH